MGRCCGVNIGKKVCIFWIIISVMFTWVGPVYAEKISQETALMEFVAEGSYAAYMSEYAREQRPDLRVQAVPAERGETYEGREDVVLTPSEGAAEWLVTVEEAGLYAMGLDYYPMPGKTSWIQRSLTLDGERPFTEAMNIQFTRIWANEKETIQQDREGNDITPALVEDPEWVDGWLLRDVSGYYDEPYLFYFSAGEHRIRMEAVQEPMAVASLYLTPLTELPNAAQILEQYMANGYQQVELEAPLYFQAENASRRSDAVLVPTTDRASPMTEPESLMNVRLNTIGGGNRFSIAGQWIEWDLDVEKEGLYYLAFRVRQDSIRGVMVTRRLSINGQVPFREADALSYTYNAKWQLCPVGDGQLAIPVYLHAGRNTVRLEATLDTTASFIRQIEEVIQRLNEAYRKIVVITGTSPDLYRDYNLHKQIPEVFDTFGEAAAVLETVGRELKAISGEKSSFTAQLETFSYQLQKMVDRPDTVQKRVQELKSSLSSLGSWLVNIRSTPLEIDYLVLYSHPETLKKSDGGFFASLGHEIKSLFVSFVKDYNSIGSSTEADETIEVWINSGRDQANVLKDLIEARFAQTYNVGVELKLVQGALLQSMVAGIGPDVALTLGGSDPVNYALRHAVVDLSQFPDYEEIEKRFNESAVTPFRLNGGVYALPERESFPMLFYRTDILEELELEVPETWEDVYDILPVLQRNMMGFGLPVTDIKSGVAVGGESLRTFGMLLYQNGGAFYTEAGRSSALDSEASMKAFQQWTEFYSSYGLPVEYDLANRFRSGEMPIAVADYTFYNTLMAFAPEIRNCWEFTSVPGTMREDGSIDISVPNTVMASVILAESVKEEAAWKFLKWWTDSETQVAFARGLESIMGETARYPVANKEAMEQLPWTNKHYKALVHQWENVKGIPEVAGGYFTGRHVDNAFREVYNNHTDARETLLDYIRVINTEIASKRQEFGMDEGE